MADAKTEALKRALTEEEILLGLEPEALEARTALQNYQGRRRTAVARSPSARFGLPKTPPITETERAAQVPTDQILAIQEKKQAVLDSISEFRKEDNPAKRMELARKIMKDYRDARTDVITARLGAKGTILAQKMRSRDAINERLDKLESQYGMLGAKADTRVSLTDFTTGIDRQAAGQSIDPQSSIAQRSVLAAAYNALKSVNDPVEQQRLLTGIDTEMIKRGFAPLTAIIQDGTSRKAAGTLGGDELALNDLVTLTEKFPTGQLQAAAQMNQMTLEKENWTRQIEEEERKLGGNIGAANDVIDVYRTINKEMGGFDADDPKAMKPFMDQIEQLDEMMNTLKRPTFTDDYQRARAQMLAHPMFDDYMKMRGFVPGQEDLAIKQLTSEAGPTIQKQAAIAKMTRRVDPDDPRTAIGKVTSKLPLLSKIPMSKRRQEALRLKAEGTAAADPEARAAALEEVGAVGESRRAKQERVRQEAGIDPGKTLFQQVGITPAVGQSAEEQFNRAEIAAEKEKASGDQAKVGTATGREGLGQEIASAFQSAFAENATGAGLAGDIPSVDSSLAPLDSGAEGRQRRVAALRQLTSIA